jgi:hypothetical protein
VPQSAHCTSPRHSTDCTHLLTDLLVYDMTNTVLEANCSDSENNEYKLKVRGLKHLVGRGCSTAVLQINAMLAQRQNSRADVALTCTVTPRPFRILMPSADISPFPLPTAGNRGPQ